MTMLEPNWNQERPDVAGARSIWEQSVFTADAAATPAVGELLKALRSTHVNGGAVFGRFRIADSPNLHWFVSRNRFDEITFIEHLLTSDALRAHLPNLNSPASMEALKWEWWSSYLMAGDWARTLMAGGAYEKFKREARYAMEIGERACFELFGDRFEDVMVFRSWAPWSDWFFNVAWDMTWVGIDKREAKAWILCITDTD